MRGHGGGLGGGEGGFLEGIRRETVAVRETVALAERLVLLEYRHGGKCLEMVTLRYNVVL